MVSLQDRWESGVCIGWSGRVGVGICRVMGWRGRDDGGGMKTEGGIHGWEVVEDARESLVVGEESGGEDVGDEIRRFGGYGLEECGFFTAGEVVGCGESCGADSGLIVG